MEPYQDILHMPHHVSERHPPMSRANRAAQFAPFAALVGYDDAVRETARLTEAEIFQDEEQIERLNRKLIRLSRRLEDAPTATITYFEPDREKSGGAYRTLTGMVRRVDAVGGEVELILPKGRHTIPMQAIISIEGEGIEEDDLF